MQDEQPAEETAEEQEPLDIAFFEEQGYCSSPSDQSHFLAIRTNVIGDGGKIPFIADASTATVSEQELVIAEKDSHVTAKKSFVIAMDGSTVIALDGTFVQAYKGSTVVAMAGSHVDAYEGSIVIVLKDGLAIAYKGAKVVGRDGSTVSTRDKDVIVHGTAKSRLHLHQDATAECETGSQLELKGGTIAEHLPETPKGFILTEEQMAMPEEELNKLLGFEPSEPPDVYAYAGCFVNVNGAHALAFSGAYVRVYEGSVSVHEGIEEVELDWYKAERG